MKTVWLRGDGRLVHSIDAAPQSLDEALPVIKPVMANCKNCHEDFRIED
jgi:cytochrome c556